MRIFYYVNVTARIEGSLLVRDSISEIPLMVMNKYLPSVETSVANLLIRRDTGRYPHEQLEEII